MSAHTPIPTDRASFNAAMADILADHASLRHLATTASRRSSFTADDMLSLADALAEHEKAEARLFALPFLPRTPEAVTATAARVHRHRLEYAAGKHGPKAQNDAAARFIEALFAHLDAEEAWLAHEADLKNQRLWTAI